MDNKNVLVLDPHGDDGAICCMATLLKLMEKDYNIHYIVLSISERSVPEGFPRDIVGKEVSAGLKLMGIDSYEILHYPVREFQRYRQDILDKFIELNKRFNPCKVFLPSRFDTHQDHKVVCEEGIRAFRKTSSMYGYDMPWNAMNNHIHRFEIITKDHLKKKMLMIKQFKSQARKGSVIMKKGTVYSLARSRGAIINVEFAEAFEGIREISK